MATLTLRSQKGSPLTNQEVDDNFSNLNSSKLEVSGGTLTGPLSVTILTSSNVNGDEGGKLLLAKPATNTTIDTSVTLKLYQNKLQIFETGGLYRGAHLDITTSAADIGSKILTSSNINSYAPTLTGVGASGTWSINISGNSATVTSITSSQITSALGYTPYNSSNPSGYITGYTETDTLATVTGRGASTTIVSSFNGGGGDGLPALRINQTSAGGSANWFGSFINSGLNAAAGKWGLLLLGQAESSKNSGYLGFQWQGNSSNSNAVTLGLYAADNLLRVYGGGYTEMSGSARAPIFYDLDDTGYYLNPAASGSVALRVQGEVRFHANDGSTTHFNYSNGGSENYLRGTTYFDSGNVYFSSGRLRWTGAAYDWDDTSYYVDPNSLSNIYRLNVVGYNDSSPSATYGIQMGGGGAGIEVWNFNPNGSGAYRNLTFYGTGWNGSAVVTRDILTIGNYGGYVGIRENNPNNFLQIGSVGGSGYSANHIAIGDGTYAYAEYLNGSSYMAYYTTSGYFYFANQYLQAAGSMRAPIFYDSNDTTYYTDPASRSVLNDLTLINGKWYTSNNESGQSLNIYVRPDGNNNYVWRHIYGGTGTGYGTGVGGYGIYSQTLGGDYSIVFNSSGYVTAPYSFRSPIFYDSNDTNYYIDPNSGSRLAHLYVGNVSSSNDGGWNARLNVVGSSHARLDVVSNSDGIITTMYSHTGQGVGRVGTYSNHPLIIMAEGGAVGGWAYSGSLRSPIFYDSNDTAYYIDPNSSSVLNGNVVINQTGVTYTSGDNTPIVGGALTANRLHINGSIQLTNNDDAIVIGRGTATFLKDEELGFGWGGGWYMTDADWIRARNSKGIYSGSGIIRSDNSIRGPIFYDQDNTGYYLDPSSTSNLNKVYYNSNAVFSNYGIGQVGLYSSYRYQAVFSMGESYLLPADGTTTGNLYGIAWSHPNAGGIASNLNSHGILMLENGGFYGAWGGGSLRTPTDIRAPIFYDYNDTGYYIDPNSASVLNSAYIYRNFVRRENTTHCGISWYSPNYTSWCDYMSPASAGSSGPTGNITAPSGSLVTTWALRRFIENASGYGWTFESGSANGQPSVVAEIRSSDGSAQFNGMVRTPIYYDSNDTNYYVNPNGVSHIYNLTVGTWANNQSYPGVIITGDTGYNYNFLNGSWSGSVTAGFLANCADQWEFAVHDSGTRVVSPFLFDGGGNHRLLMGRDIGWGTMYIEAANSFRAPIFYDSDNTGYYLNPNGRSNLSSLQFDNGNLYMYQGDGTALRIQTAYGWINFGAQNSSWTHVYADRAFYTNQDWYVNGNLMHHDGNASRARNSSLIYYAGFTLDANTMPDNSTGFTYSVNAPYTGPIARFSTGGGYDLWLNSPYSGNGYGLAFRTRNGDSGSINSWQYPAVYGINANGGGSLYSTIYYDSNDTGYYVNPNSDSYLSAIYANNWFRPQGDTGVYFQSYARGLYAADSGSNSYGNVTTYGSGKNGWQGWGIGSRHCFMSTGGDNVGVHDNSRGWIWYWDGSYMQLPYGYTYMAGSSRSPIFYDSDNTGYYCDPNGNTNVAGSITAGGNITAYSDKKLKANIVTITNALNLVKNLRGVIFTRTDLPDKEKQHIGVIAQEIEQYLPQVVENTGANKSVAYGNITALLIEAVKEQQQQIEQQQQQINNLTELVKSLANKSL